MRTLYLHVGMPKTGSTWLQDHVFPRFDHLSRVLSPQAPIFRTAQDDQSGHRVLADAFRRAPELWEDMGDTLFQDLLSMAKSGPEGGRDLLMSEEGMGRQASRPAHLGAHLRAISRTARHAGFRRMRIFAFIRRQDTWLASHYAQVSGGNPQAGQADFASLVDAVTDPYRDRHTFGTLLDWHALHRTLCDAAGPENVLLLPHERLLAERAEVLAEIAGWMGLPDARAVLQGANDEARANVRSGDGHWRLRDRPRRIGPLQFGKRLRRRGGTIKLTPDLSHRILKAYSRTNAALCAAGVDLGRHGYGP